MQNKTFAYNVRRRSLPAAVQLLAEWEESAVELKRLEEATNNSSNGTTQDPPQSETPSNELPEQEEGGEPDEQPTKKQCLSPLQPIEKQCFSRLPEITSPLPTIQEIAPASAAETATADSIVDWSAIRPQSFTLACDEMSAEVNSLACGIDQLKK